MYRLEVHQLKDRKPSIGQHVYKCECGVFEYVGHYPKFDSPELFWLDRITTRLAALDDGSGWVSVNERLPKKNEEYIVCGTGFEGKIVTTLEWKKGKWFSDVYQKYIEQIKITHWQPLPKSPNNDN